MSKSTMRKADEDGSPRAGKRPRLSNEQPEDGPAPVARTDSFSDGWFGSDIDFDDEALQAVDEYDVFRPDLDVTCVAHSGDDPFLDSNNLPDDEEEIPSSQGEADANGTYDVLHGDFPSSQSEAREASPTMGAFKRVNSRNLASLGPPIRNPIFPTAFTAPLDPQADTHDDVDDEPIPENVADIDFGSYVPIPPAVGFASTDTVLSDPSLPMFMPASQVPFAKSELASTSAMSKPAVKLNIKLAGGGGALKPITAEEIRASANKLMDYQQDTKWKPKTKQRTMPPPALPPPSTAPSTSANVEPAPVASKPPEPELEPEDEDDEANIDFSALVAPTIGFASAASVNYDDAMPAFISASQVPRDKLELESVSTSAKPAIKLNIKLAGGAGGMKPLTEEQIKASAEKLMAYQQDTKWKPQARTRLPRLASASDPIPASQIGVSSTAKLDTDDVNDSGIGLLESTDSIGPADLAPDPKGKGKQRSVAPPHGMLPSRSVFRPMENLNDSRTVAARDEPAETLSEASGSGSVLPPTLSRATENPFSSRGQPAGTPARIPTASFQTPVRPTAAPRTSFQTPSEFAAPTPMFSQASTSTLSQAAPSTLYRLGLSQRKPKNKGSGFTTPFKPGMAPGEKGREALRGTPSKTGGFSTPLKSSTPLRSTVSGHGSGLSGITRALEAEKEKRIWERAVFDTKPKAGRKSLCEAGFIPSNGKGRSNAAAANIPYLTLKTAASFRFPQGGHPEMLKALQEHGCTLAEEAWVHNHWAEVVWKLSGLARTSALEAKNKWSWEEVVHQMLYRYEREINRAERPAVRRIQERDASAAQAMVLCVSDVQLGNNDEAEIELTDGWYRIRATTDKALGRAAKKGKLVTGRKIAISGARLEGGHEGKEVLKAYHTSSLKIAGNSTSLARWDARLGFQSQPFIASLRSLTADGGSVSLLDVTVTKLFPVGYVETDATGRSGRPYDQSAEDDAQRAWEERHVNEASKWRTQLENRLERMKSAVHRLSSAAKGTRFNADDSPPSDAESFLENLEDSEYDLDVLKTQKFEPVSAAWLAESIKKKCDEEYERREEDMERELATVCPPRKVRNFRVAVIKDARQLRKPAERTAQLTVWDVLSFGSDPIRIGQRYLLANVQPSQPGSWRKPDAGGDIYLSTRRDTKWTSLSGP